jgi:hypothetical protein
VLPDAAEGPRAFADRAASALPQHAELIIAFARAFEAQRYGREAHSEEQLRKSLRALRKALPWRLTQVSKPRSG